MIEAKAQDLATQELIVVAPDDRVLDVAKRIAVSNAEAAIVVTNGQPVGIVTEQDLVRRVLAAGRSPEATRCEEVMTSPVRTLGSDAPADEAARLMALHRLRHIPLLENGHLAGILTDRDLIAYSPLLFEVARAPDNPTRGPRPTFETSICEGCETLSSDLTEVNGALLCEDCAQIVPVEGELAEL